MMSRPHYYRLKGKIPEPCSLIQWARWDEKNNRVVKQDHVGPMLVSTVFLGLDHQWSVKPDAPPILFETMIFGADPDDSYQERYSTWEEAEQGHARALTYAQELFEKSQKLLISSEN